MKNKIERINLISERKRQDSNTQVIYHSKKPNIEKAKDKKINSDNKNSKKDKTDKTDKNRLSSLKNES